MRAIDWESERLSVSCLQILRFWRVNNPFFYSPSTRTNDSHFVHFVTSSFGLHSLFTSVPVPFFRFSRTSPQDSIFFCFHAFLRSVILNFSSILQCDLKFYLNQLKNLDLELWYQVNWNQRTLWAFRYAQYGNRWNFQRSRISKSKTLLRKIDVWILIFSIEA